MTYFGDHWNTQAFPPRQGGDPWKGHSLSIHSLSNTLIHTHTHTDTNTHTPSLFNTFTHTCTHEIDTQCDVY